MNTYFAWQHTYDFLVQLKMALGGRHNLYVADTPKEAAEQYAFGHNGSMEDREEMDGDLHVYVITHEQARECLEKYRGEPLAEELAIILANEACKVFWLKRVWRAEETSFPTPEIKEDEENG